MPKITLFDKSVDIHQPHHYEQFGGKRHRVFGRRVKEPAPSRSEKAALAAGGKSTFTSSGVTRIPVNKAMLPIFFYAFGATHRAIGLFGTTNEAPKVLLDAAVRDILDCCTGDPRPFFMGDHAERIINQLAEQHRGNDAAKIKATLSQLAETFHQTIEYLFDGNAVSVDWR